MGDKTYSIELMLVAVFAASLLILLGTVLRYLLPPLQKMHMPAAVIGGIVGVVIGPQVFGYEIAGFFGLQDEWKAMYKIWKELPAYLISVVFAALMMGKKLPSFKKVMDKSSQHLVVGYSIAWGHYIVGILITLFCLIPFLDANPLSSALIAIGFQGGYGTAAGLGGTYAKLGFPEGYDLALGMATAGKVSAILVGLVLINIAVGFSKMNSPTRTKKEHLREDIKEHEGKKAVRKQRLEMHFSADTLILHTALLCFAIAIGWGLRELFFFIESFFMAREDGVMQYIPLFPMALIGGVILQGCIQLINKSHMVNHHHIHSISHSFLDLLIVVAIATLSMKTISENWLLLVILIGSGVGWNLLAFFVIAPRLYTSAPWIRGLGDFAHSTGAATTALLLMKIIDPNDETGARTGFTMKQPFYEPIVGGGLITALALPMIFTAGLYVTLIIALVLFVITLLIGWKFLGIKEENSLFDEETPVVK